jgi:hypothetical protein
MPKVAYRFLPCGDDGSPRENSQLTLLRDESETIGVGSVIETDLLGYKKWQVIEVRTDSGPLISSTHADGKPLPVGGTLVCRGVR